MKITVYWLTTELENGNGTETNLFPSQEELEKAMAAHIAARIEEIRDGNEPAAEQALAAEVEALLAAGDFDRAWELYKDGEAGDGSDSLCNPDDCFWWGQEQIELPAPAELARLAAYEKLHDGLSEMIEGGRLRADAIPDDYAWLVESLAAAASMEGRAS